MAIIIGTSPKKRGRKRVQRNEQETLDKKEKEIRTLLQQNAQLEAHLQQLLHPIAVQTTDWHQLQNCMDTWHGLIQSEECLQDAEEECPTHMDLQEEDSSKIHTATIDGGSRAKVCVHACTMC